jgi:hypothetical protein
MTRPIARPIASSDAARPTSPGLGLLELTTPNDAPPAIPSRVSSGRLIQVQRDLTDRDRDILSFVSAFRLASGQQLWRRFFATSADGRSARRALARLVEWRVLERLPRRVGGVRAGSHSYIYALGPVGARVLATEDEGRRRLSTPGARYIAHTLAVTEVAVALQAASDLGVCDVLEVQAEPGCWRSFIGAGGARLTLKPDLYVRLGVGAYEDSAFIEVDMATESGTTVRTKAQTYLTHFRGGEEQRARGVYPRVIWAVPDERRAQVVLKALGRLPEPATQLFAVTSHDLLTAALVAVEDDR